MEHLLTRTIEWAEAKGIMEHGTIIGQLRKFVEEALELAKAVKEEDVEETKDALGDVQVTLILLLEMLRRDKPEDFGLESLRSCLSRVLEIIELRTGRMENGIFVKEKGE